MELERATQLADELKAASDFSFDQEKFREDIHHSNTFTQVIKTQLYLEHVLIEMLNEEFKVPGAIDLRRTTFPQKLDLCIALGLVAKDWRAPVAKVNEMRNRIAHKLDAEAGPVLRKELAPLLPEFVWKSLEMRRGPQFASRDDIPLSDLFSAVVIWTEMYRREAKRRRIQFRYDLMEAADLIEKYQKKPEEALTPLEGKTDGQGHAV